MAANNILTPVRDRGGLQGFGNLLKKENRSWWKTRTWIVQTIIWMLIVNGLLAMVLFVAPQAEAGANQAAGQAAAQSGQEAPPSEPLDLLALTLLFTMGALAPAVGVVIIGQEAVIHEKQSGTAAWVLSKPASRSAFILSKITADALGILVTMVIIQGVVAYLQITAATGIRFPIPAFIGGMGMVYLALLFYLALTIMLGTLFNSRGAVIGIPMLLIFGYQLFLGIAPWLARFMPWALTISTGETQESLAVALVRGQALADLMPLYATAAWILVFVGVALWRFNREEF
jgi:ABC-2 type transport system permease protein